MASKKYSRQHFSSENLEELNKKIDWYFNHYYYQSKVISTESFFSCLEEDTNEFNKKSGKETIVTARYIRDIYFKYTTPEKRIAERVDSLINYLSWQKDNPTSKKIYRSSNENIKPNAQSRFDKITGLSNTFKIQLIESEQYKEEFRLRNPKLEKKILRNENEMFRVDFFGPILCFQGGLVIYFNYIKYTIVNLSQLKRYFDYRFRFKNIATPLFHIISFDEAIELEPLKPMNLSITKTFLLDFLKNQRLNGIWELVMEIYDSSGITIESNPALFIFDLKKFKEENDFQ